MATEKTKRPVGNELIIKGNVIEVYLNQSDDRKPFLFDIDDLKLIQKYVVCKVDGKYAGAYDKELKRNVYMHRAVMGVLKKGLHDYHVDHLNGDERDNRKCNLRICHKDDAANQSNVAYDFSPFKVVKERLPDDSFRLLISNGLVDEFEIIYDSFSALLKDYKYLYEHGVDGKGFFDVLYKIEQMSHEGLLQSEQGEETYLTCLTNLENIIDAVNEMKKRKSVLESHKPEGKNDFIFENGMMIFNNDNEVFRLVHNLNDSELAGAHNYKPNGELIFK